MATKRKVRRRSRAIAPVVMKVADEARAEEHERRIAEQKQAQLQRLKDEARALLGMVEGQPGIVSLARLQELLEKAGDDIGNGRFIVRYLGAERYLDVDTVAVLITLRQNLIAERERPTTADIMAIDAAVVAYYNFLRAQGWMGNLSLVVEQELFGQKSLSAVHGPVTGAKLREDLERLSEVILPLQDRAHRMMIRSLQQLPPARRDPSGLKPKVDQDASDG